MGIRLLFLIFALLPLASYADEPRLDYQALGTGVALLVAPAPFSGNGLDLMHDGWELEGFSYAATDILDRAFPKELNWLSPVLVGSADLLYRTGEGMDDLTRRKLVCDLLGVAARVSLDFKF